MLNIDYKREKWPSKNDDKWKCMKVFSHLQTNYCVESCLETMYESTRELAYSNLFPIKLPTHFDGESGSGLMQIHPIFILLVQLPRVSHNVTLLVSRRSVFFLFFLSSYFSRLFLLLFFPALFFIFLFFFCRKISLEMMNLNFYCLRAFIRPNIYSEPNIK